MVKVLFLDIDGVLNSASFLSQERRCDAISREMVEHINSVIRATSCKIVLSSTWRIMWPMSEIKAILRQHGLIDVIIGKTRDLGRRDDEILDWLKWNGNDVAKFAVVDDDISDITGVKDRLVAPSFVTGCTEAHADLLVGLLR